MNIISNNCLVGRLYQILNKKFETPFVWNSIVLSDFCNLIKNYNKLNLKNIDIFFTNEKFTRRNVVTVLIDKIVKVYFTHHVQNKNFKEPYRKEVGGDILYYDMLSYVKNKWLTRVERLNGNPIFIYTEEQGYGDINLQNFIDLKTSFKKMLITTNESLLKYNSDDFLVYYNKDKIINTFDLAKILLNDEKIVKYLDIKKEE